MKRIGRYGGGYYSDDELPADAELAEDRDLRIDITIPVPPPAPILDHDDAVEQHDRELEERDARVAGESLRRFTFERADVPRLYLVDGPSSGDVLRAKEQERRDWLEHRYGPALDDGIAALAACLADLEAPWYRRVDWRGPLLIAWLIIVLLVSLELGLPHT